MSCGRDMSKKQKFYSKAASFGLAWAATKAVHVCGGGRGASTGGPTELVLKKALSSFVACLAHRVAQRVELSCELVDSQDQYTCRPCVRTRVCVCARARARARARASVRLTVSVSLYVFVLLCVRACA
eukprot:scaffold67365_cov30-Tisochrysis_lutea.AAC.1